MNRAPARFLHLKQLKEVIEQIYASKEKFDQRCVDARLPRETMEQHMYTYLWQKYGLKSLIVEWANAIIQGVKTYSHVDNDVAVFGKILRNEVDEEFRYVQLQLRETVRELLKEFLKRKNNVKCDEDIMDVVHRKIYAELFEEEWSEIVRYMYNPSDAEELLQRLQDLSRKYVQEQTQSFEEALQVRQIRGIRTVMKPKKVNKVRLPYVDVLKVLLDFQLDGHERFLSNFLSIFRAIDVDLNGVLNEAQFTRLVHELDPSKEEENMEKFLRDLDPFNFQRMTFSECVTYLSSELTLSPVPQSKHDARAELDQSNLGASALSTFSHGSMGFF